MMIACGVFFFICSLNNCQMKSMAMAEDDDSMWHVLLYLQLEQLPDEVYGNGRR